MSCCIMLVNGIILNVRRHRFLMYRHHGAFHHHLLGYGIDGASLDYHWLHMADDRRGGNGVDRVYILDVLQ